MSRQPAPKSGLQMQRRPQDPNKSQGIALKEASAKVLSIILARRLMKRFKEINPTTQCGHIGCQDAQHVIK